MNKDALAANTEEKNRIKKRVLNKILTTPEKPVLRSRNYLFLAPAPTLSIISAPAPAQTPAIYIAI